MNGVLRAAMTFLSFPGAVRARLTWPYFSFSSFRITSQLRRQDIRPRTVIDVGANVGQFAVAAASTFPDAKVYSFEPLPDCVPQLRRNVSGIDRVEVFAVAIGDHAGTVPFHVNSHAHSSSVLPLARDHQEAFPDAIEQSRIEVPLATLDEQLRGRELERPVLLKLDVQGYEPQAMRGAAQLLKRTDYLLIEVSFKPMYQGEMLFQDIEAMARDAGFRFLRPVDWLSHPDTGEVLQMDALFVRESPDA